MFNVATYLLHRWYGKIGIGYNLVLLLGLVKHIKIKSHTDY